ncbi:MAG: 2-iminoacetate synthase ThiH [Methylacidiphilales bacterium]|nr:2-iminoacetate synthase ThiH [Candidatus Methylacidiphilales bacterium]
MSFVSHFDRLQEHRSPVLDRFRSLLEEDQPLESMARESARLTRQNFGRTMRLFAPLYVSNECVNICKYCGFSRNNPINRVTLDLEQVRAEARYLVAEGFRSILLVAGEHPKFVSEDYLEECVRCVRGLVPSVSLEVGPLETEQYRPIVRAGADGLIVYQETYDRAIYADLHVAGPKKDFEWRMECPERAYAAGFRRIGIGALLGLADWRREAFALAAHAEYLLKHCWKSSLTVSFPRLRPAAGEFQPQVHVTDREFTRLVCAFRICFPQVGLVLSTREPPSLRDGLAQLGITLMSAGAHTEPGGYTRVGAEKLHRTEKGKALPVIESEGQFATEQFAVSDNRPCHVVVSRLQELGLDPVWKDWDYALSAA